MSEHSTPADSTNPAPPASDDDGARSSTPPPHVRRRIRQEIAAAMKGDGARRNPAAVVTALPAEQLDDPLTIDDQPAPDAGPPSLLPTAALPSDDPPLPRIPGHTVVREISRGGQATVFEAIQNTTERRVAVKVITGGPFLARAAQARFDREALILAKLDHPSIVGIIDRGRSAEGSMFLTMDYIDGENLDVFLNTRAGAHPMREVLGLFIMIAQAIHAAHVRGVVHRDLKPSNIKVDRRGQPHILDFGLANLEATEGSLAAYTITTTGNVIGSLPWTSPEQVSGSPELVGPRSDVYALGVMLYEALTGRRPYDTTGTLYDVAAKICSATPPPPRTMPDPPFGPIDPPLSEIVLAALSKRPEGRHATAAAFAAELEAYCAGRTRFPSLRLDWRRIAAYAAVGLVTIGGAYASYRFRPRTAAPVEVVQLPTFTHDTGISFVKVPSGTFGMGSPPHEEGREADERLRHGIPMSGFFIAATEVTRGQWKAVMGDLPEGCPSAGEDDRPVDHVTWEMATEFCRRLSATDPDGRAYRLPTEIEWEYACRGGTNTPFAGNNVPDLMSWHADNSGGTLRPVRQGEKRNHWGLYDMHGNAAEWCLDRYRRDASVSATPDAAPTSPERRVVRGGSVQRTVTECRAAARASEAADVPKPALGFRILTDTAAPPRHPPEPR